MAKDQFGLKKATPQSDEFKMKLRQPARDLSSLKLSKGAALEKTLNLDTLQPELNAKMKALNTSTVNTSTVDRFIGPIQSAIESFLEDARRQTNSALTVAQRWRDRWALARSQRQAEQIANLLIEAQKQMHQGNWSAALRSLDRVLKMDDEVHIARYLKAICLAGLQRLEEALRVADEGSHRCPDPQLTAAFANLVQELRAMVIFMPVLLGIAAMLQGEFKAAISRFENSLALKPRQPEVFYYKAICHMLAGEPKNARATVDKARQCSPSPELEQVLQELTQTISFKEALEKAQEFMAEGDFAGALRLLNDQALNKVPGVQVPLLRAICQTRLGQAREAEKSLQQIEHLDNSQEARQIVAQLREQIALSGVKSLIDGATSAMEKERWQEALGKLKQAEGQLMHSAPNHPIIHYYLAICYLRTNDPRNARTAVQKARSGGPDSELRGALDQLERAIDNYGKKSLWEEALEALKNERCMDALTKLNAITSQDNKNAWAHFYTAICFVKLAEGQLKGYSPNRQIVTGAISAAKEALNKAERYCERGEKDLRSAITNLKKQLP
jgi:tetratricopeptide (TPR) repeat protein